MDHKPTTHRIAPAPPRTGNPLLYDRPAGVLKSRRVQQTAAPFASVDVPDIASLQVAESARFYYENLVHVPACTHFSPASALTISVDQRAADELLKHHCLRDLTAAEIGDESGTRTASHADAKPDPRMRKLSASAFANFALDDHQYDLIILDVPQEHSGIVAAPDFYRQCASHLRRDGLLCLQVGMALPTHDHLTETLARLSEAFDVVRPYLTPLLQGGGLLVMACASQTQDPALISTNIIETRLRDRGIRGLQYYNGRTHQAAMALPNFVRVAVARTGARWL